MYKISLLVIMAAAQFTFADDGGFIAIKVKDVQMLSKTLNSDGKLETQPVLNPNYDIKITGGEANKLMRLLPPDVTVMTAMYKNYPKWIKAWNANFRALAIRAADENKPSLLISCDGAELGSDMSETTPPKITAYKDGAHCTVSVEPSSVSGDEPVEFRFDPIKELCGK